MRFRLRVDANVKVHGISIPAPSFFPRGRTAACGPFGIIAQSVNIDRSPVRIRDVHLYDLPSICFNFLSGLNRPLGSSDSDLGPYDLDNGVLVSRSEFLSSCLILFTSQSTARPLTCSWEWEPIYISACTAFEEESHYIMR